MFFQTKNSAEDLQEKVGEPEEGTNEQAQDAIRQTDSEILDQLLQDYETKTEETAPKEVVNDTTDSNFGPESSEPGNSGPENVAEETPVSGKPTPENSVEEAMDESGDEVYKVKKKFFFQSYNDSYFYVYIYFFFLE